uniref:Fungal_trans domain-containing protein n=1 Tax=Ganoderma boninense TaxID=34458 RepID=A0A5K1JUG9_9APHY|nr:Fungal_trans domain-containing protein [Ganoderma boninense]
MPSLTGHSAVMLFKSRLDPDTRSAQDLIVFCHAQERILLPLPKTYETVSSQIRLIRLNLLGVAVLPGVLTNHTFQDAQAVARTEFSIAGELTFETDDIPGFEDAHVRIHQAAWEGISPVIRSVTVRVANNTSSPPAVARPRPSETLSSGSRRISSQKRMSMTGPPPVRLSVGPTTLAPAARIVERQSLSARKSPLPTSTTQFPSMPAYKEPGPSSYKSSPPSRQSPATTPAPAPIEELDDDEEEVRLLSPKKKNLRPRILSDYGVEETEETDEAPEDPRKATAESGDEEEEEFDQLDDAEFTASAGSSGRSQHPRTSKASRTSSASIVELDGPPAGWTEKTEPSPSVRQLDAPQPEPKAKVKAERVDPKLERERSHTQGNAGHTSCAGSPFTDGRALSEPRATPSQPPPESQPPVAAKSDESFLIMIEYAEDPDGSRSLFKTRARHTVSRVLMQACRTFELQEYYPRARLVLVVEEEDVETGEVGFRRKHTCARHETMGEAGAEPNARFVVEIAEEDE